MAMMMWGGLGGFLIGDVTIYSSFNALVTRVQRLQLTNTIVH